MRFRLGDEFLTGRVVSVCGPQAFIRTSAAPTVDADLILDWTGPGRIRVEAIPRWIGDPAPDGTRGVTLELRRIVCYESAAALTRFITGRLGLSAADFPPRAGGLTWWTPLCEDAEPSAEPLPFKGPAPKVAGLRATEAPPPPLVTGREATTVPALRAWFKEIARVAVYLNIPCAYTVAGAMYWGRALRLNDRFLQVNTAQVVPGLGVRIRCDLTIEIDELRRPVSLFGIMNQKKDPPGGSTYKAQLGVRFNKIDEGGSPGLLLEYLSRHQDDPAVVEPGGSPPPGPPAGVEPGGSPAPGPPAGDDGPQK